MAYLAVDKDGAEVICEDFRQENNGMRMICMVVLTFGTHLTESTFPKAQSPNS